MKKNICIQMRKDIIDFIKKYSLLENSIRFENRDGKIDEQTHIGE